MENLPKAEKDGKLLHWFFWLVGTKYMCNKKQRKQIQNFSGQGNVDKSQVDTQVKKCSRVKYEQTSVWIMSGGFSQLSLAKIILEKHVFFTNRSSQQQCGHW